MTRGLLVVTALVASVACVHAEARVPDGEAASSRAAPSRPVKFTRDIRPILARHCFACHGPDENQRKAKLRLDLKEDAFAEREGGRPFAPGSVEESEALRRILSEDATEQMPPGGKEKRLAPEQVALLKSWVGAGGEVGVSLGVREARESPAPSGRESRLASQPDRRLRAGPARARGALALARGRAVRP